MVLQELHVHAPNLLHLLNSITSTKTDRDNQKAIIGMCASILLKHHYSKMSLVQKIVSVILYAGHTSKQVVRLLLNRKNFIPFNIKSCETTKAKNTFRCAATKTCGAGRWRGRGEEREKGEGGGW